MDYISCIQNFCTWCKATIAIILWRYELCIIVNNKICVKIQLRLDLLSFLHKEVVAAHCLTGNFFLRDLSVLSSLRTFFDTIFCFMFNFSLNLLLIF